MNEDVTVQGKWMRTVVQGCFGYHAIPGNMKAVDTFYTEVGRMRYKTLCRRSQKKRLTWEKMYLIINQWLPKTRILHPWPEKRFERYITKVRA